MRPLIFSVFFLFSPLALSNSLDGAWEGSGHMLLRENAKDFEPCELTTIQIAVVANDLVVSGWNTCMIDWGIEPLSFVGGQVLHGTDVIGTFTRLGFQFEYVSKETDLKYAVHAWLEGETLVLEEFLDVPSLWWSKGYYKYRRK